MEAKERAEQRRRLRQAPARGPWPTAGTTRGPEPWSSKRSLSPLTPKRVARVPSGAAGELSGNKDAPSPSEVLGRRGSVNSSKQSGGRSPGELTSDGLRPHSPPRKRRRIAVTPAMPSRGSTLSRRPHERSVTLRAITGDESREGSSDSSASGRAEGELAKMKKSGGERSNNDFRATTETNNRSRPSSPTWSQGTGGAQMPRSFGTWRQPDIQASRGMRSPNLMGPSSSIQEREGGEVSAGIAAADGERSEPSGSVAAGQMAGQMAGEMAGTMTGSVTGKVSGRRLREAGRAASRFLRQHIVQRQRTQVATEAVATAKIAMEAESRWRTPREQMEARNTASNSSRPRSRSTTPPPAQTTTLPSTPISPTTPGPAPPRRARGEGGTDGPAWWVPMGVTGGIVRRPLPPPGRRPAGDGHLAVGAPPRQATSAHANVATPPRRARSRATCQTSSPLRQQEVRVLLAETVPNLKRDSEDDLDLSGARTPWGGSQSALSEPSSGTRDRFEDPRIRAADAYRQMAQVRRARVARAAARRSGEECRRTPSGDVVQMGTPLPPAPSLEEIEMRELTWARGRTFCFALLYLGLSAYAVSMAWQPWMPAGDSARSAALAPLRRRFFASEYGAHYALVCMIASTAAVVSTLTERAALALPLVALGAADLAADCAETALGCANELSRLGSPAALVYALVAGSLLWAEASLWMGAVRFAELASVRAPDPPIQPMSS